jgi:diaminohydroxyphosphoribosylaminopyrimidine deaminase/5-amino-6-(5-phosphoribosylamino)uracil reductase
MVGIGTALADDPRLTARGTTGRDPVKVIVDSRARLPVDAQVLHETSSRVIVAVTEAAPPERVRALQSKAVQVLTCASVDSHVDLRDLMQRLGKEQLSSVLVEGGSALLASLLQNGLVDKAMIFIAPVLIGGKEAPTPIGGEGCATMSQGVRLHEARWQVCEPDMLLTGYLSAPADGLESS